MYIQTELLLDFQDYSSFLNFDPENSLFFDIETTGLSSASAEIFLIGTIHRENGTWILTQFLSESSMDEEALLRHFLPFAGRFETLIHFNGTTFDLPFVKTRSDKYHLAFAPSGSLDLYQIFRPLKKLLNPDRMNQQTLEKHVGYLRTDELSGRHMIALYRSFVKTADPELKNLLLLHNHDDLIGMTKLLSLCSYLMLTNTPPSTPVSESVSDTEWSLRFRLPAPLPAALECTNKEYGQFIGSGSEGILRIPAFEGELKYFFSDYRNYVYLPLEDLAIHKNAALGIDKEFRIPATKDTCYTRKQGLFFPDPSRICTPLFQRASRDHLCFFEYDKDQAEDPAFLTEYVFSILKKLILGNAD